MSNGQTALFLDSAKPKPTHDHQPGLSSPNSSPAEDFINLYVQAITGARSTEGLNFQEVGVLFKRYGLTDGKSVHAKIRILLSCVIPLIFLGKIREEYSK